jgi:hypothetical protein
MGEVMMPPLVQLRTVAERLEWEADMVGTGNAAQERRLAALAVEVALLHRRLSSMSPTDEELLTGELAGGENGDK